MDEAKPRDECMVKFTQVDRTVFDPIKDRDDGARWFMGAWVDIARRYLPGVRRHHADVREFDGH